METQNTNTEQKCIVCRLTENGEYPLDTDLIGGLKDICKAHKDYALKVINWKGSEIDYLCLDWEAIKTAYNIDKLK